MAFLKHNGRTICYRLLGDITTVLILAVLLMSLDFLVRRVGLVTLGHTLFYELGATCSLSSVPNMKRSTSGSTPSMSWV